MSLEEWRRNLKGHSDPDGRRGSDDLWRPQEPDADDRRGQVDLFGKYTPARELTGPSPASPAPPPSPAPTPAAAPAPRRRFRRLLVGLVVVLALAAGAAAGAAFERVRAEAAQAQLEPDVQVITRPVPQVPPMCQSALDKATQALGAATQVERALAEHASVMNKLMQGRISGKDALRAGMPSLARGAQASARLDDAAAQYHNLSRQCGP